MLNTGAVTVLYADKSFWSGSKKKVMRLVAGLRDPRVHGDDRGKFKEEFKTDLAYIVEKHAEQLGAQDFAPYVKRDEEDLRTYCLRVADQLDEAEQRLTSREDAQLLIAAASGTLISAGGCVHTDGACVRPFQRTLELVKAPSDSLDDESRPVKGEGKASAAARGVKRSREPEKEGASSAPSR